ncbi:MAG: hypothetical protein N3E40_02980, partial [Dehalococcoidia bacterium]|nr:hypothetical protein [Dehalococcoidia bacterium]
YIGGRVAGYNMAGCNVQFDGVTAMNSLSYFGTPVISAGMVTVPEGHDYEVISRLNGTRYRRIVLNNNRIVGLAFVRDVERAGVFWGLMKDRIDVSSFKSALDDDSFSTAALPASLRTKRNDLCGWNLFHTTSQVEGSK